MSDEPEGFYRNITLNDVQLASAYYPILIELAKNKERLTYGQLVDRAKARYPSKPVVQKAIAVSAGRKLDVVRIFTSERELPDLTCLIINKGVGECGVGFTKHFDPVVAREKVFAFDWSAVTEDFDGFIDHTKAALAPKPRRKRAEAIKVMSAYYSQHKAVLPQDVSSRRDLIIDLLMEGLNPDEAFTQALDAGRQP